MPDFQWRFFKKNQGAAVLNFSSISRQPSTFRVLAVYLPITFRVLADYLPSTCRVLADYLLFFKKNFIRRMRLKQNFVLL